MHLPNDVTEGMAEHGPRLQPSINLHAPVTAFMFSCSGTQDIVVICFEMTTLEHVGRNTEIKFIAFL